MKKGEAFIKLSVCGLDCSRCVDYENSEIKNLSSKLSELLNGYERIANLKAVNNPIFNEYPKFVKFLSHFTQGACGGCRSNNLKCPIDCHAKTCYRNNGIEFCFEC